ncbi:MAG: hypothetical protein PUE04_00905 [Lachnospira sp.]|nr:hypothetical protein [Lachnospira sp.]
MNFTSRRINLNDICRLERAIPNKVYKAGTCYIKLSAVDDFVGQLQEPGILDGRYAAIEPIDELDTEYLYIAINRAFPEFLRRYRTTINLQADTLKHFYIEWHDDKETRRYIVQACQKLDREIAIVSKQIEEEKTLKQWYLSAMMA